MQQTLALGVLTCCGFVPLFFCSPSGRADINKCDSEQEALAGRKLALTV